MATEDRTVRWMPLESNPEVMNKYASALGIPSSWKFQEIYGVEPDLLSFIPRPVVAVVLLYPITEKSESEAIGAVETPEPGTYFMKQTIGNACGTVGFLHCFANNRKDIALDTSKPLAAFLDRTADMSPAEKGRALETDEGMASAHEAFAKEGQTEAPPADSETNLHFIAFVQGKGKLYEMDGRQDNPKCHGNTTDASFLEDVVAVARKFMARDPDQVNFNLMALCKE